MPDIQQIQTTTTTKATTNSTGTEVRVDSATASMSVVSLPSLAQRIIGETTPLIHVVVSHHLCENSDVRDALKTGLQIRSWFS